MCAGTVRQRINPEEWAKVFLKFAHVMGGSWSLEKAYQLTCEPSFRVSVVAPLVAGLIAGFLECCARYSHGNSPYTPYTTVQTTWPTSSPQVAPNEPDPNAPKTF